MVEWLTHRRDITHWHSKSRTSSTKRGTLPVIMVKLEKAARLSIFQLRKISLRFNQMIAIKAGLEA